MDVTCLALPPADGMMREFTALSMGASEGQWQKLAWITC